MSESPKKQVRWVLWAVSAGVLLSAALVGWLGFHGFVDLFSENEGPAVATVAKPAEEAEAIPAQSEVRVAPGGQVELAWEVTNAGKTIWTPDAYRFESADPSVAAIPLPGTVGRDGTVTIRTTVTAPAALRRWNPEWTLTGPHGPVHGGKLTGSVTVEMAP